MSTYKLRPSYKTLPVIQKIIEVRGTSLFGVGKTTVNVAYAEHLEPQRIHRLEEYQVDQSDRKYWKLQKQASSGRDQDTYSLPFLEARSLMVLYKTGREFSFSEGTFDQGKIEKYLRSLFDCPVSIMCRNINWRAHNLLETPGVFELMVLVDAALYTGRIITVDSKNVNVADLEMNFYNLQDELKEQHIPLVNHLNARVEAMAEEIKEMKALLEKKADKDYVDRQLEMKADKAQVEAKADKEYVDRKMEMKADKAQVEAKADKEYVDRKMEMKADKAQVEAKADKEYVDSKIRQQLGELTNRSILRPSSYRRVHFNSDSIEHPIPHWSQEPNTNMSHCVKFQLKGKLVMVGILPICVNHKVRWSRIGMVTDCEVAQTKVFTLGVCSQMCMKGGQILSEVSSFHPSIVLSDWKVCSSSTTISAGVVLNLHAINPPLCGTVPTAAFLKGRSMISYESGPDKLAEEAVPKQIHKFRFVPVPGKNYANIGHLSFVRLRLGLNEVVALILGPSIADERGRGEMNHLT